MAARVVEIWDRDQDGAFAPTLHELLCAIQRWGTLLQWRIFEVEAVGDLSTLGTTLGDLRSAVESSARGLDVSWQRLTEIAAELDQVIEATILGSDAFDSEAPSKGDGYRWSDQEVVIQALDSTFWRISSKDPGLVNHLSRTFQDVRSEPLENGL